MRAWRRGRPRQRGNPNSRWRTERFQSHEAIAVLLEDELFDGDVRLDGKMFVENGLGVIPLRVDVENQRRGEFDRVFEMAGNLKTHGDSLDSPCRNGTAARMT